MAGAVSAGAYTAGVLDFLLEALDAWEGAKKATPGEVPAHEVRLTVASGASAGSMCAAILGVAKAYQFPHVGAKASDEDQAANPFYRSWVKDIDILPLLDPSDLDRGEGISSLLNSDPLDRILAALLDFRGEPLLRPYFPPCFCLRFSLGNLKGVPYRLTFQGNATQGFDLLTHRDYLGFGLDVPSGGQLPPWLNGHRLLAAPNSSTDAGWATYGQAALASGAFPLALKARTLVRPYEDYNYRKVADPPILPCWPIPLPGPTYPFLCVDGGTMDNEPLELVHEVLAFSEPTKHNPQAGPEAKRALIMLDPFADPYTLGPEQASSVTQIIIPLLKAWKMQCRFTAEDLALAWDPNVYSRFLIAPSRGAAPQTTKHPLASGGLGAFLGFFHESFRRHDFLLGRRNAQQFLRTTFVLPMDNHLFLANPWPNNPFTKSSLVQKPTGPHLPIIPLIGDLAKEEVLPPWPAGRLDPETLRAPVRKRLDAVLTALEKDMKLGWVQKAYLGVGLLFTKGKMVDAVMAQVRSALADQKL
jgi:hypothetical protein